MDFSGILSCLRAIFKTVSGVVELTKNASLASPLSLLFKFCLNNGTYPDCWKIANWVPIYKKCENYLRTNYRPVSLLCCPSKVFERLIFNGLYGFCTENGLLTYKNSGFKPLDSTVNQLIHILHSIYNGIEDHNDVCGVFLDVSKAFDRVCHEGLLIKLRQFGVCGNLLFLIELYLSNRKQGVVLNGFHSEWKSINAGVPQGSILGLLFFLFI